MPKQIFLDILIVLALPIALIFGYFYFNSSSGQNLLSFVSSGATPLPGEGGAELGAKTKAALTELKSIDFDKTIFTDPVFLSLEDFTQPIVVTPLGRDYPFFATPEIRTMSKRTKPVPTSSSSNVIKIPANADVSQKLDALKSGVR